jgi:hypothetical protein
MTVQLTPKPEGDSAQTIPQSKHLQYPAEVGREWDILPIPSIGLRALVVRPFTSRNVFVAAIKKYRAFDLVPRQFNSALSGTVGMGCSTLSESSTFPKILCVHAVD